MLNIILLLYSATGCEESVPLVPPLQPRHSCGQKDNLSIPPEFMYCLSTSSSTSRMRVNICTYKGGVCIIDMCTYIMGEKRMHKYRYKNGGYISKGRICIYILRIYTHTCTPLSTHTNIHAHENPGSVLHPPWAQPIPFAVAVFESRYCMYTKHTTYTCIHKLLQCRAKRVERVSGA